MLRSTTSAGRRIATPELHFHSLRSGFLPSYAESKLNLARVRPMQSRRCGNRRLLRACGGDRGLTLGQMVTHVKRRSQLDGNLSGSRLQITLTGPQQWGLGGLLFPCPPPAGLPRGAP